MDRWGGAIVGRLLQWSELKTTAELMVWADVAATVGEETPLPAAVSAGHAPLPSVAARRPSLLSRTKEKEAGPLPLCPATGSAMGEANLLLDGLVRWMGPISPFRSRRKKDAAYRPPSDGFLPLRPVEIGCWMGCRRPSPWIWDQSTSWEMGLSPLFVGGGWILLVPPIYYPRASPSIIGEDGVARCLPLSSPPCLAIAAMPLLEEALTGSHGCRPGEDDGAPKFGAPTLRRNLCTRSSGFYILVLNVIL
ncbi:hypothetical protein ACLOJK_034391 [Asimina triloba]